MWQALAMHPLGIWSSNIETRHLHFQIFAIGKDGRIIHDPPFSFGIIKFFFSSIFMDDWDFHRQAIVNWPLVDEAELKRHSVFQDRDPGAPLGARAVRAASGLPGSFGQHSDTGVREDFLIHCSLFTESLYISYQYVPHKAVAEVSKIGNL